MMWLVKSICWLVILLNSQWVSAETNAIPTQPTAIEQQATKVEPEPPRLELVPFTAWYRGEALGMAKKQFAIQRLNHRGDQRYHFESEAKALVYSVEESADFFWRNGSVVPQQYWNETQTLFKVRRSALTFDHHAKQIFFNYKGKTGTLPLELGAKDPLTSFIALGKQVDVGATSVEFPFVKGTKSKTRRFKLVGTPRIDTEYAGQFDTYHLVMEDLDPGQTTDLWLLKDHPYVMVRIDQRGGDDDFLLELTDLQIN